MQTIEKIDYRFSNDLGDAELTVYEVFPGMELVYSSVHLDRFDLGAREVIENDLIKELDCYKEGKIIYFIQHANVWYTSTGGIQALDTMLADLEVALLG